MKTVSEATKQRMRESWTPERRAKASEYARQRLKANPTLLSIALKGVPKSDDQKRKMSEAKLGVPKSASHKLAMRDAHILRYGVIHFLMDRYTLDYTEAVKVLSNNKQHYYELYGGISEG